MVKLIELYIIDNEGAKGIEATFSVDGELVPLKVEKNKNLTMFNKVTNVINDNEMDQEDKVVAIYDLLNPESAISQKINSNFSLSRQIEVVSGRIKFNGKMLDESLSTHLISMLDEEYTPKDEKKWKAYLLFLDNLHQNVDERIREQLFRWINYENENGLGFSFTDDGCLVGYKGCNGTILEPVSVFEGNAIVNGVEYTKSVIPNKVGSIVEMPRFDVTADPHIGCSEGLHIGSRAYASNWGEVLLLVKVNPRDIVSVPFECDSQKIRACRYEVLKVTDISEEPERLYSEKDDSSEENNFSEEVAADSVSIEDVRVGDEVVVDYDGKSFEGVVSSIYGDYEGLIIYDEIAGETKHIKDYRIKNITYLGVSEEYQENEPDSSCNDCYSPKDIVDIRELKVGDEVRLEYDGKSFEGEITSIYNDYEGLIVYNELTGKTKHIKDYRITDFSFLEKNEAHETYSDSHAKADKSPIESFLKKLKTDKKYKIIYMSSEGQRVRTSIATKYDENTKTLYGLTIDSTALIIPIDAIIGLEEL